MERLGFRPTANIVADPAVLTKKQRHARRSIGKRRRGEAGDTERVRAASGRSEGPGFESRLDPYVFCSHLSGLNFASMHLRGASQVWTGAC